jgi:2-polyprenyl-3-methyl-5-hydroxy-6-metoxy-1,4-benzoquinol methylase
MAEKHAKTLKNLYGKNYVEKFEKDQSPLRIAHLMEYVDLSKEYEVADFGCGNGMLLDCVKDNVHAYYGVDFSDFFIRAARNRQKMQGISNAEFFCESIESFCSRNQGKFDAGFVIDLAEHVYDEDLTGILTAIRNTLKPGGKLYVHTPNADFFLEIMKKKNFVFRQFKEHVAVRNVCGNIRILEIAGFSRYEVMLLPHYNILRYIHVLSFLPLIGKYFQARIFIIAEK